ncbi:MAG: hypothetical protein KAI53_05890 [Candidatus Aenigmarchaeota archaeon]|nr:hypothetical protein [Candidatus Aenigmarchaeota archaeon]
MFKKRNKGEMEIPMQAVALIVMALGFLALFFIMNNFTGSLMELKDKFGFFTDIAAAVAEALE